MSNLPRIGLLLSLLVPACTVGEVLPGGGGDDQIGGGDDTSGVGPDAAVEAPEDFSLAMTPPAIDTTLGTTTHYTLTLQSDNFAGPVTLTATGVPTGATATFAPASVTLPLDGQVTVDLAIVTTSEFAAGTSTIAVEAVAAPGTHSASGSYVVANEYIYTIGAVGTGAHGFPSTMRLPLGAKLTIKNGDTIGHRIHSDGGAGFPHQDATMPAGASYSVTPGDVGGYTFYCHDHGVGVGVTNLVVQ